MWENDRRRIIFLAYCNRYILPLLCFFVPVFIGRDDRITLLYLGVAFFLFSLYNIVGTRLRWRHIYCAYQNGCRKKMTPEHIRWDDVSFSDKYGLPILFAVIAFAAFACYFLPIV
jgi:hypothetical protein